MDLKAIIFSNKRIHRILRHFFFWMGWFCIVVASSSFGISHMEGLKKILQLDSAIAIQRILYQVPFCYFVLYFLVPVFFLRKRYLLGIVILLVSIVAEYWITFGVMRWTSIYISAFFGFDRLPAEAHKILAILSITHYSGVLVCCSLMCSLKFLKFWYIKQQENVLLVRENVIAELQLLKAQVHPHFLFNTLNNIYSFTLIKSPLAGELLEKLSGILHYMILEGQNSRVPLEKEVKLIQDYVSLERVRYGNRLDIYMNIKGSMEGKMIAPLLMIPFVENSFKHGSSKMLKNPKVELSIVIDEYQLMFRLSNNKPGTNTQESPPNPKGGIGLKNVAKRLQLLYPGKHELKIEATDTSFSIDMNIEIEKTNEMAIETVIKPTQPPSYASA